MKKKTFFVSIGSNVEPAKNIPNCKKILNQHFPGVRFSSIYETEPMGLLAGPEKFWNLVAAIDTELSSSLFTEELRKIETALGRSRTGQNKSAARPIDLDLLPRPNYQKLGFVMIPLAELAPGAKDPETGQSFTEIAKFLPAQGISKLSKIDEN